MKNSDYDKIEEEIEAGGKFDVKDYGKIVAAGKGEPSPAVKAEIAARYKLLPLPSGVQNSD